ncbi:MAG TPA: HAD family hydrolase [Bacillales bacterium]|nr:HAD family hydrolase [Bacillales bacterium]
MNNWIQEAELLIFDLDGTLYENINHFEYLANQIKKTLPADKQAAFTEQYKQVQMGEHPLSAGKVYDADRDSILSIDPLTGIATAVEDWNGTPWSADRVKTVYPDVISYDFEHMIAVGDGWWLPPVIGLHLEGDPEALYEAYRNTMDYMASDAFQFKIAAGLKDALKYCSASKPLVLVTNSEKTNVQRLLKELDLQNLFTDVVASAEKPARTKTIFQTLMARYRASAKKTVAIGDNFINEIAPALALNMKAVYIQAFGPRKTGNNLKTVRSLEEIL